MQKRNKNVIKGEKRQRRGRKMQIVKSLRDRVEQKKMNRQEKKPQYK